MYRLEYRRCVYSHYDAKKLSNGKIGVLFLE